MFDAGFVIGFLGCLITLVSVVLTSMRAKESNIIAKNAIYRDLFLKEKKDRFFDLSTEITGLLDLISSHNLRMYYESACAYGEGENGILFNNDMNAEFSKIYSTRVRVLLGMPSENKEFDKAMSEMLNEFSEILVQIKKLKSYVMQRYAELKLNPSLLNDSPTMLSIRQYIYDGYKKNEEIKDAIYAYNLKYSVFVITASEYLSLIRQEYDECLELSDKVSKQNAKKAKH